MIDVTGFETWAEPIGNWWPFAIPFVMSLAAFGSSCGYACNDTLHAAVTVHLRDAKTGAEVCVADSGSVTDGAFSAPLLQVGRCGAFYAAPGRPGTYEVRVTSAGYLAGEAKRVVVPRIDGECPDIIPANVVIDLTPDPAAMKDAAAE